MTICGFGDMKLVINLLWSSIDHSGVTNIVTVAIHSGRYIKPYFHCKQCTPEKKIHWSKNDKEYPHLCWVNCLGLLEATPYPMDFFWRYIKNIIYSEQIHDLVHPQEQTTAAVMMVTPDMTEQTCQKIHISNMTKCTLHSLLINFFC